MTGQRAGDGPDRPVLVVGAGPTSDGVVQDPDGRLHERFGGGEPTLCVIRPDGHLGFRCAPPSLAALKTHLDRLFVAD